MTAVAEGREKAKAAGACSFASAAYLMMEIALRPFTGAYNALADQLSVLQFCWRTPRIRVAIVIRWVERLGGGLGSAVAPLFLLALGLDATQMGMLQTIGTVCAIVPSPIYGWTLDRLGPFVGIMVASTCCGIGCGAVGLAQNLTWLVVANVFAGVGGGNLPFVINAHVTKCVAPEQRALVLAGFTAQCLTLRMIGQAQHIISCHSNSWHGMALHGMT